MENSSLTLSRVSELLKFQRDHLNRLLKKESGLTFSQIRSQLRLKKAQGMLIKGSSVGDVSLAVGMNDQNYFARWFRSQVGLSPTEWHSHNVDSTHYSELDILSWSVDFQVFQGFLGAGVSSGFIAELRVMLAFDSRPEM